MNCPHIGKSQMEKLRVKPYFNRRHLQEQRIIICEMYQQPTNAF